jgi:hypothetical protein
MLDCFVVESEFYKFKYLLEFWKREYLQVHEEAGAGDDTRHDGGGHRRGGVLGGAGGGTGATGAGAWGRASRGGDEDSIDD